MKHLLRRYWRQITMGALVALPILALVVLGVVWLIHSPWFVPGFIAMALAGIGVALLGHAVRKSAAHAQAHRQPADAAWAPAEIKAWQGVQDIAARVQSTPPQDLDGIHGLADEVVKAVAHQLHGVSDVSWMRFTLPELLLATEQAAKQLRESIRTRVPGAESVSVADVMVVYRFYAKHEAKVNAAWWAYRVFRLVAAPQVAAVQEIKGLASSQGVNASLTVAQGWLARLFAEELGRAAIQLYAGRYRLAVPEARQRITEAAPAASGPVPVRILIAGQVNAGKSSLTNALLGAVKSPVSELPTPGDIRTFRTAPNHELDLVVLDTPGLTARGGNQQGLLDACGDVDLIIWLAQANHPARAVDVAALGEIRRWFASRPQIKPPPMVLVMTHIDALSPSREWAPPYDLARGDSAKASSIRQALEHVGQTLGMEDRPMIPVALRPNEAPYNLDALWAAIGANLNDAQLTALDRGLKRGPGLSLPKEFQKFLQGGRFLARKLVADHFGSSTVTRD